MWEVQFWEFNLRREQLMEKLCIIYLKILKKNLTALFNLKNYEVLSQNFHKKRLKTEFQILFLETEKYFQNIEEDLPLIVLNTEQLKMHLSFIIFSLNCYAPRNSKLICTCKDCHQLNHWMPKALKIRLRVQNQYHCYHHRHHHHLHDGDDGDGGDDVFQ